MSQRGASKDALAYRAQRFGLPSPLEKQAEHYDYRWECMDFDSEGGHRCAHCSAKYPADHHEEVEHEDVCPHVIKPSFEKQAEEVIASFERVAKSNQRLAAALQVMVERCEKLEAERDRLLLALAAKGGQS